MLIARSFALLTAAVAFLAAVSQGSTTAQAQAITCDGQTLQSFDFSGGVLTSGVALQPGAVYSYSNVGTGVDARFEILSFVNGASLQTIDNDAGLSRNLQPELIPNAAGGGLVNLRVSFFQAGTTTPLSLGTSATMIDVDGDNVTLREFVEFEDRFVQFTINNPTNLDVNVSGPSQPGRQRFEARTSTVAPGIDPTAFGNAARAIYTNTSSFEYAIGTLGAGTTTRLTSLSFDCPAFPNPVTIQNPIETIETTKLASVSINGGRLTSIVDAGDLVTYEITIENTGNVNLSSVGISSETLTRLGGGGLTLTSGPTFVSNSGSSTQGDLIPGEVATFSATYLLVQADIDAGGVSNTVTGTGTPASGTPVTDVSDDGIDNDGNTVNDQTETSITPSPQLSITKAADDDTLRSVNDVIVYTYTVTNTGNVTINGVNVSDTHNGSGPAPSPNNETLSNDVTPTGDSNDAASNGSWDQLAPGDSVEFTGTYTVTQADVDTLQ